MDFIQGTALILLGDILQAEVQPGSPDLLFSLRHPLNKIPSSFSALNVPDAEVKQAQHIPELYLDYLEPDTLGAHIRI